MKIAVLTNAYPPDAKGGAGRIAATQVELLRAAGHEVRVWHVAAPWLSPSVPAWRRLLCHLKDLRPQQHVAQEILAWKPDVLLAHNLTGVGFGTPRCVQRRGIRWVHLLHDVQLFEPSGQCVEAGTITHWQRVWAWMRRQALGSPDAVISPTKWLLDQHVRRGFFLHATQVVIPNPAPREVRFDRARHAPLRALFVSRLSADKGTRVLEEILAGADASVAFTVVGDGPDASRLRQEYPQARFLGALPTEDVLQQMRESDVLLFLSQIAENQPTVLLEAASVGLPVLATGVGGVPETLAGIDQGGAQIVVGGAPAFLETLRTVATESDSAYAARCEAMWHGAETTFDATHHLAALVEVLKS